MPAPDPSSAVARPDLSIGQVSAIKALARGEATPDQQRIAVEYLLHGLSVVDGLSFRPDALGGQRETDFAEGRRFVGLQLRRIVLLPANQLVEDLKPGS